MGRRSFFDTTANGAGRGLPNSIYFDEQANRTEPLMEIDVLELPMPSAEELAKQRDFVMRIHRASDGQENCSDYILLTRDDVGGFRWSKRIDATQGLDGNWAIVIAQGGFRSHDRWISAEQIATYIADALSDCGYVPDSIDKIICLSYIHDVQTSQPFYKPVQDVEVPILYSMDENYPALVARECLEVNFEQYEDVREGLHVWPGHSKARLRPTPFAQEKIDRIYASCWKGRLRGSLDNLVSEIAPMESTKVAQKRSQARIEGFIRALCFDDPNTPDVFGWGLLEGLPAAENLDPGENTAKNELPMSADVAREMLDKTMTDFKRVADVVRIWQHFLGGYDIEFIEQPVNYPADVRLEKMCNLGEVLGIDHAVHAYLSGVPLDYL